MKILLTGGTGFVGRPLAERFERDGHEVRIVSRRPSEVRGRPAVGWEEAELGEAVAASDVVVHLAGAGIFDKRWSAARKEVLRKSRVETTRLLAELAARSKLQRFVSTSAIGYYGPSDDRILTESAPPGEDFLARLCVEWEEAVAPARAAGVRVATVRTGIVLGRGGGALKSMLPPFLMGVGGPLGNGRQWCSWIHLGDLVSLYTFLATHDEAHGVFNGTAPNPVRMKDLARTLGKVLHRPALLPVPRIALRLALGEVADVLLQGQRVLPRRTEEAGFRTAFPELESALRDLLAR